MISIRKFWGASLLLLLSFNTHATVGGPLVIEVLGVNQDSTRFFWTFHFQGESDDPFPIYIYDVQSNKIQERHGWSKYPKVDIGQEFVQYRKKYALDTNHVPFKDYKITYRDSGYVEDTINYLPYPIFGYDIQLTQDTLTVWNCGHRNPVPRIIRTYQLLHGVRVHVCTFLGVPMEGGYMKDTVLIDDPRITITMVTGQPPDTTPSTEENPPLGVEDTDKGPSEEGNNWWWIAGLALVSTFLFIILIRRRKSS